MVIKLTVSQTSGCFLSMRAGDVYFNFWPTLLMNIINCFAAQIQHLQENECKVTHTHYNTFRYVLRRKGWSLAKTSLHAPFSTAPLQYVVSRRQPHE